MQPHLALAYSSQAATHGGIAAGWSLSIPSITEDVLFQAKQDLHMSWIFLATSLIFPIPCWTS
jgi:hypothetical protein